MACRCSEVDALGGRPTLRVTTDTERTKFSPQLCHGVTPNFGVCTMKPCRKIGIVGEKSPPAGLVRITPNLFEGGRDSPASSFEIPNIQAPR